MTGSAYPSYNKALWKTRRCHCSCNSSKVEGVKDALVLAAKTMCDFQWTLNMHFVADGIFFSGINIKH